jgi:nicotinamidase-related amidase
VPKSAGSAFTTPALGAALEAHRVRCVTIAGLFAKGCVRATAVAALRRGLVEEVLRDAVACSSDWSRDRALGRLTEGGARVTAVGHGRARDRTE